jgi:hypothetical protein
VAAAPARRGPLVSRVSHTESPESLVARGGIEPPTYRFQIGDVLCTRVRRYGNSAKSAPATPVRTCVYGYELRRKLRRACSDVRSPSYLSTASNVWLAVSRTCRIECVRRVDQLACDGIAMHAVTIAVLVFLSRGGGPSPWRAVHATSMRNTGCEHCSDHPCAGGTGARKATTEQQRPCGQTAVARHRAPCDQAEQVIGYCNPYKATSAD